MCFERQEMGMQPACTKTCPTEALYYTDKSKLAGIKADAKARGLDVYDGGSLGLNVVFLLEDGAANYGLPAKPSIPTPTYLWRSVMGPGGIILFCLGLFGVVLHLVNVGPKEVDDEVEDAPTPPPAAPSAPTYGEGGEA
jgi:formate dehydrogenase iron-sulfur subunit